MGIFNKLFLAGRFFGKEHYLKKNSGRRDRIFRIEELEDRRLLSVCGTEPALECITDSVVMASSLPQSEQVVPVAVETNGDVPLATAGLDQSILPETITVFMSTSAVTPLGEEGDIINVRWDKMEGVSYKFIGPEGMTFTEPGSVQFYPKCLGVSSVGPYTGQDSYVFTLMASTDNFETYESKEYTVASCSAPTGVYATATTAGKVTFNWDYVEEATSYYIKSNFFEATSAGNANNTKQILKPSTAILPETGVLYQFQIKSCLSGGVDSQYGEIVSIGVLNAPDVKVEPTTGDGSIVLSWTEDVNVKDYTITCRNTNGIYKYPTIVYDLDNNRARITGLEITNSWDYFFYVTANPVEGSGFCTSAQTIVGTAPNKTNLPAPVVTVGKANKTTEVTLIWDEIPNATSYEIRAYKNYNMSDESLPANTISIVDGKCTATVTGLTANIGYTFKVTAKPAQTSTWCQSFTFIDAIAGAKMKLDTPTNLTVADRGAGEIVLSWDAVDNASRYMITLKPSNSTMATYTYYTTRPEYTLTLPVLSREYTVTVAAADAAGSYTYANSNPASITVLKTMPSTDLLVQAYNSETKKVTLEWSNYTRYANTLLWEVGGTPESESITMVEKNSRGTFEVTLDTAGVLYTYSLVSKVNECNADLVYVSDESSPCVVGFLAGPENIHTSVLRDNWLTLSWDANANAAAYVVTCFDELGNQIGAAISTESNSADITGLTASTKYMFKVAAKSSGTDGWLDSAESTTEITTADPLSAIAYTATGYDKVYDGSAHGITVTVSDPTVYTIQYRLKETDEWSETNPTITNVTPDAGTTVYFRITADGYTMVDSSETILIKALPINAPTNIVAGDTLREAVSVSLSWDAVADAASYSVQYSSDHGATWTPFTPEDAIVTNSTTVTGLTGETSYLFQVRANPAAATPMNYDESAWSVSSASVTTKAQLPTIGTPTVTRTSDNAGIDVSWTAIDTTKVSKYKVTVTANGVPVYYYTADNTATNLSVPMIDNTKNNVVTVTAIANTGEEYAESAPSPTITILAMPSDFKVTSFDPDMNQITFTWNPVEDAISYNLSANGETTEIVPTINAQGKASYTIDMPSSNTVYNLLAIGNTGTIQSLYTSGLAVGNLLAFTITANATKDGVVLDWDGPDGATNYNVQYKKATETEWTTAVEKITVSEYTVTGLDAQTDYTFRVVSAQEDADKYFVSAAVIDKTTLIPLTAPTIKIPTGTNITTSSMNVTWTSVANAGSYLVYVAATESYNTPPEDSWTLIDNTGTIHVAITQSGTNCTAAVTGLATRAEQYNTYYHFRVVAVPSDTATDYTYSSPSASKYKQTKEADFDGTPVIESVSLTPDKANSIRVTWADVAPAGMTDCYSVRVYGDPACSQSVAMVAFDQGTTSADIDVPTSSYRTYYVKLALVNTGYRQKTSSPAIVLTTSVNGLAILGTEGTDWSYDLTSKTLNILAGKSVSVSGIATSDMNVNFAGVNSSIACGDLLIKSLNTGTTATVSADDSSFSTFSLTAGTALVGDTYQIASGSSYTDLASGIVYSNDDAAITQFKLDENNLSLLAGTINIDINGKTTAGLLNVDAMTDGTSLVFSGNTSEDALQFTRNGVTYTIGADGSTMTASGLDNTGLANAAIVYSDMTFTSTSSNAYAIDISETDRKSVSLAVGDWNVSFTGDPSHTEFSDVIAVISGSATMTDEHNQLFVCPTYAASNTVTVTVSYDKKAFVFDLSLIIVTTLNDNFDTADDVISLREAIAYAEANIEWTAKTDFTDGQYGYSFKTNKIVAAVNMAVGETYYIPTGWNGSEASILSAMVTFDANLLPSTGSPTITLLSELTTSKAIVIQGTIGTDETSKQIVITSANPIADNIMFVNNGTLTLSNAVLEIGLLQNGTVTLDGNVTLEYLTGKDTETEGAVSFVSGAVLTIRDYYKTYTTDHETYFDYLLLNTKKTSLTVGATDGQITTPDELLTMTSTVVNTLYAEDTANKLVANIFFFSNAIPVTGDEVNFTVTRSTGDEPENVSGKFDWVFNTDGEAVGIGIGSENISAGDYTINLSYYQLSATASFTVTQDVSLTLDHDSGEATFRNATVNQLDLSLIAISNFEGSVSYSVEWKDETIITEDVSKFFAVEPVSTEPGSPFHLYYKGGLEERTDSYIVTVRATADAEGQNKSASKDFVLTIVTPTLTLNPTSGVVTDATVSAVLSTVTTGKFTNNVSYTFTLAQNSDTVHFSVNNDNELIYTKNDSYKIVSGTYDLTVTATDGFDSVTENYEFVILENKLNIVSIFSSITENNHNLDLAQLVPINFPEGTIVYTLSCTTIENINQYLTVVNNNNKDYIHYSAGLAKGVYEINVQAKGTPTDPNNGAVDLTSKYSLTVTEAGVIAEVILNPTNRQMEITEAVNGFELANITLTGFEEVPDISVSAYNTTAKDENGNLTQINYGECFAVTDGRLWIVQNSNTKTLTSGEYAITITGKTQEGEVILQQASANFNLILSDKIVDTDNVTNITVDYNQNDNKFFVQDSVSGETIDEGQGKVLVVNVDSGTTPIVIITQGAMNNLEAIHIDSTLQNIIVVESQADPEQAVVDPEQSVADRYVISNSSDDYNNPTALTITAFCKDNASPIAQTTSSGTKSLTFKSGTIPTKYEINALSTNVLITPNKDDTINFSGSSSDQGIVLNMNNLDYYQTLYAGQSGSLKLENQVSNIILSPGNDVITGSTSGCVITDYSNSRNIITLNGDNSNAVNKVTLNDGSTIIVNGKAQNNITVNPLAKDGQGDKTVVNLEKALGESTVNITGNEVSITGGLTVKEITLNGDYGVVNLPNSTKDVKIYINGDGAIVKTGSGNDTICLNGNKSIISLGAGNDLVYVQGISDGNSISLGKGDDTLISCATAGGNTIYTDEGNDFIIGGGGSDRIFGGLGNCFLAGGGGGDCIVGGSGRDILVANITSNMKNKNDEDLLAIRNQLFIDADPNSSWWNMSNAEIIAILGAQSEADDESDSLHRESKSGIDIFFRNLLDEDVLTNNLDTDYIID